MKNHLNLIVITISTVLCFSCSPTKEVQNTKEIDLISNQWIRIGAGGGGGQFTPSINPHDSTNFFVKCDMTGSYVTYNAGQTWENFNLHRSSHFFVHDPQEENTLYAFSIGLMKSTDKGDTWQVIYPTDDELLGFIPKGDHATERLVTKDSLLIDVPTMAVDPDNSDNLYIVVQLGEDSFLHYSNDQGQNWTKDVKLDNEVISIYVDPTSDPENRKIYLQGRKNIIVWQDGETTVNENPEGVHSFTSFANGYDKETDEVYTYGISGENYYDYYFKDKRPNVSGVFKTTNGGVTWESIQEPLLKYHQGSEAPEWRAIATSAFHPNVIYISYNDYIDEEGKEWIGVAKSIDYGQNWEFTWKDKMTATTEEVSENFAGGWLNERWGPSWGENPFSIAVYAHDPDLVITTDFGRSIKSLDGGKTWEQIYTTKTETGWATRGIDVTTTYQVTYDPFDDQHVFIAAADVGLLESVDGGKSWKIGTEENGVPAKWENSCYQIEFDEDVKGKGWMLMSWIHDIPRPKMWRRKKFEDYPGGILRTTNSGKTWEVVSEEIGEGAYTSILMDPESEPGNRTLYACGFGKGAYKSTDDGKTWTLKNNGIEGEQPLAWELRRRDSDGAIFLIEHRQSEDGSFGNELDGNVYISTDGAESWRKMNLPEKTNGPTCVAFDPENPDKIILSAWGRLMEGVYEPDTGGGIFISEDSGNTWRQVLSKDQHIEDMLYDERTDRYYAVGFNGSAYYSETDGEDWERINGFNFKWGQNLSLDPFNPDKLFITTFGGGVWHGPATGDPNATQDIVSPKVQW